MPPRLSLLSAQFPSPFQIKSPPSFLLPFFQQQQSRYASILASLSDTPGAYNKKIRRGRGPASGKGKTSGRGHKGQKQHGKVPAGFMGGQTRNEIVHGSRGFNNIFSLDISPINLDRIQEWINQGRIDPKLPITVRELAQSRCIHGVKDGVKLLARGGAGALTQPVNIVVSRASSAAIEAVEAAGGSITTRFYTRHAIKRILTGKTDPFVSTAWSEEQSVKIGMGADKPRVKGEGFQYRLPDPSNRKDVEYYRDPAHRGYLSHLVQEGEGPSLYFKAPGADGPTKIKKGTKKTADNRVW